MPAYAAMVKHLGAWGNLVVAISSFSLGFYSLNWSMVSEDASGVDICNSLLVIVNGFINLI